MDPYVEEPANIEHFKVNAQPGKAQHLKVKVQVR